MFTRVPGLKQITVVVGSDNRRNETRMQGRVWDTDTQRAAYSSCLCELPTPMNEATSPATTPHSLSPAQGALPNQAIVTQLPLRWPLKPRCSKLYSPSSWCQQHLPGKRHHCSPLTRFSSSLPKCNQSPKFFQIFLMDCPWTYLLISTGTWFNSGHSVSCPDCATSRLADLLTSISAHLLSTLY